MPDPRLHLPTSRRAHRLLACQKLPESHNAFVVPCCSATVSVLRCHPCLLLMQGLVTARHRGGGSKRLYRLVDFNRALASTPAGTVQACAAALHGCWLVVAPCWAGGPGHQWAVTAPRLFDAHASLNICPSPWLAQSCLVSPLTRTLPCLPGCLAWLMLCLLQRIEYDPNRSTRIALVRHAADR